MNPVSGQIVCLTLVVLGYLLFRRTFRRRFRSKGKAEKVLDRIEELEEEIRYWKHVYDKIVEDKNESH